MHVRVDSLWLLGAVPHGDLSTGRVRPGVHLRTRRGADDSAGAQKDGSRNHEESQPMITIHHMDATLS